MNVFDYIIGGLLLLMAVFLVVAIMLQSGKGKGLSGTITGGASDSYFGKNKGKTRDQMLSRLTTVVAIVFVVLVLLLYIFQGSFDNSGSSSSTAGTSSAVTSSQTAESSQAESDDAESEESAAESADETSAEASDEVSRSRISKQKRPSHTAKPPFSGLRRLCIDRKRGRARSFLYVQSSFQNVLF